MQAFTLHTGIAAPMLRMNIDTDIIIPSREMKSVSKKGLSEGLFANWRYLEVEQRTVNPDFILNKPEYANASILLGGLNFGCGSSREHAVWALAEFGIRAIISPGFGSIFHQNCIRNGIAAIVLDAEQIKSISELVDSDPQSNKICIDLLKQVVRDSENREFNFEIDSGHKDMLVNGLDAIDVTLQQEASIAAFETRDKKNRYWLWS